MRKFSACLAGVWCAAFGASSINWVRRALPVNLISC